MTGSENNVISPKQPITVPCPICEAAAGVPCTLERVDCLPRAGEMHLARVKAVSGMTTEEKVLKICAGCRKIFLTSVVKPSAECAYCIAKKEAKG